MYERERYDWPDPDGDPADRVPVGDGWAVDPDPEAAEAGLRSACAELAALDRWGWAEVPADVSAEEFDVFLTGDPDPGGPDTAQDEARWSARSAGRDLYRDPGPELLAAIEDALTPGAVEHLSDDEVVGLVTALHRVTSWAAITRADVAGQLASRWASRTLHPAKSSTTGSGSGAGSGAGGVADVRERRLRSVCRQAARAWGQGVSAGEAVPVRRDSAQLKLRL